MTKLTTHVLDIYSGKPGKGIKVELYNIKNGKREKTKQKANSTSSFKKKDEGNRKGFGSTL